MVAAADRKGGACLLGRFLCRVPFLSMDPEEEAINSLQVKNSLLSEQLFWRWALKSEDTVDSCHDRWGKSMNCNKSLFQKMIRILGTRETLMEYHQLRLHQNH